MSNDDKSLPAIGFLTVREYDDLGLIGGYLVLNSIGRPLEFHCTAPVRPNRAQQILYGRTLKPFLYGEQIGQALLAKAKQRPRFVCTDIAEVLSLREHVMLPVVFLSATAPQDSPGEAKLRVDAAHQGASSHHMGRFLLGGYQASLSPKHSDADQRSLEAWRTDIDELDLMEPFQRLSEAIDETQGGVSRT